MLKRWFLILIAFLTRSFVTDCPKCHHLFFGFQDYQEQIKINHVNYRIICPRCIKQLNG